MTTSLDNRGIHETPSTGVIKRAERTQVQIDIEDCARAAIKELRARGHQVRAVEIIAHQNAKQELGSVVLIDLPPISVTQQ